MLARLPKIVLVLALACSIGLHRMFLQAVAWTGMIATYSRNATLGEALAKTFDGQHPCNLCNLVRHGKASEKKQEAIKVKTKIDFWMPLRPVTVEPREVASSNFAAFASDIRTRSDSPPVPPPRFS